MYTLRIPKTRGYDKNKVSKPTNNGVAEMKSDFGKLSMTEAKSKSPSAAPQATNAHHHGSRDVTLNDTATTNSVNKTRKLARGAELGMNVQNQFGDKPKNMQDYREREKIRRQQARMKMNGNARSSVADTNSGFEHKSSFNTRRHSIRKAAKELAFGPGGKRMPRVEIQKQINFESKTIGNTEKISKPRDSKDLSEQRAAYFESLLQHDI